MTVLHYRELSYRRTVDCSATQSGQEQLVTNYPNTHKLFRTLITGINILTGQHLTNLFVSARFTVLLPLKIHNSNINR